MEQNQIIINEEKREQKARHYCEYTFKRFGIDAETLEAQLIRSAHVHGYNAGFEAARDEMQKMMNYTHQSESIPVPNSVDELEKEIKAKYFPYEGLSFEFYRRIAKYFANWQREQMMRKALDAKVDTIKVEANADVVSYCVRYPVGQRNDNYESEVKVLVLKSEA